MTIVHADALSFVSYAGDELQVDHTVLLDEFLADDFEPTSIPANVRNRQNRLLLVPDYWLGQSNLTLPSKKSSVVEPFIERNLKIEHPDLPDIGLFYSYAFTSDQSEDGNIFVIFFQEPNSYQLYKKMDNLGLPPFDITTPAFVWTKKISKLHPESADAGIGLIHKTPTASYLYFYHQEQFLFSRSIQASEAPVDEIDVLNALTYEINQSVYLFSQKKKADLEFIFMNSPREADAEELAQSLGRTVQNIAEDYTDPESGKEEAAALGPCEIFKSKDLAPSRKFLAIAQKDHAKAREWRPVQMAGVLIGILLFLILGVEHYYLLSWSKQDTRVEVTTIISGQSSREVIDQYNESLDLVLEETRRKSSWKTMVKLAKSLPENVKIQQVQIDMADVPGIHLHCLVHAPDMAEFRDTLSMLLDKIAQTFIGSPKLEARDVELGKIRRESEYIEFPIEFKFRI